MRKPTKITITRHAKPLSYRTAWTSEPKASAFTGNVRPEDKQRARVEIESAISSDGFNPAHCEIVWTIIEGGWGWVARLKETA